MSQTGAKSRGLDLHSCLAVGGVSGLPLGVLRQQGYAPQPAQGKDLYNDDYYSLGEE